MGARHFVGKWNGHNIIVVSEDNEKIMVDGKVVAENTPGLHFLHVSLKGELPDEPELSVVVVAENHNCFCIVGKPLETEYDKETKAYYAVYEGHEIEANNKKMRGKLIVDGVEVDKEDDIFSSYVILGSKADEDNKRFIAVLEIDKLKIKCQIFAEAENVRMLLCEKKGGELIPVNESDDDFFTGLMVGMMMPH